MPRILDPEARELHDERPPVVGNDPDMQALAVCAAREFARLEARVEATQAQLVAGSASGPGLTLWERLLRLPPWTEATDAARQARVLATLRALNREATGTGWESDVTAIVGRGWTYQEHDPVDAGSPAPGVLRILLPFEPDASAGYEQIRQRMVAVTPAHLLLELGFAGGFLLDASQLDEQGLG